MSQNGPRPDKDSGIAWPTGPKVFQSVYSMGKRDYFFLNTPVSRGAEMLQLFAVDMMQKVAASLRRRVGLS